MELKIVKLGNSKGIRIPKSILLEYEIEDSVELELKESHLEIRPVKKPREDWSQHFENMVADPEEELLIPDVFEDEEL